MATILAYLWFAKSSYFIVFTNWAQQNFIILFLILILIKIIGIIWPPLPGGVFTIGAIPVMGWFNAYLADLLGIIIGSGLAYFLGKKYGYALLNKIFDASVITKIKNINIEPKREIESIFLLRLFGGGVLIEIVSYAAGLFRISFRNFLLGSLFSHLAIALPFFYFAGNLFSGKNLIVNIILGVIIVGIFIKFRRRYLSQCRDSSVGRAPPW